MPSDLTSAELEALDSITPETNPGRDATHFRRVIAARKGVERAEAALSRAVTDARSDGESWSVIGAALDTTRQAAFQRFGRRGALPADPSPPG